MSVLEISILGAVALVIGCAPRPQIRTHLLLAASIVIVYWLQSRSVDIYGITFWLPTATVALVTLSWVVTSAPEIRGLQKNWPGILTIVVTVLVIDLARTLGKTNGFFPEMAMPLPVNVILVIGLVFLTAVIMLRMPLIERFAPPVMLLVILVIFVLIKIPALDRNLYEIISSYTGSPQKNNDTFVWLGFSYFAFRIIHTLRDRQKGLLPPVSLAEYVTYVLFFPAFVAGPIDRIERFVADLREPKPLTDADWFFAGRRFLVGLFKKFVVADALAVFALNPELAPQIHSTGWFWIVLYAYSFQIYFDFSGYSDIAIGIARVTGIELPENFNTPYLKPNLTLFWNNWHMTLTQWFRAYFFNPLQRWFRSSRVQIPTWLLILGLQISTMALIGLWHGVTLNFVIWGVWHGLGLFIHNRWSVLMGPKLSIWANTQLRKNILTTAGVFLTFHYVVIGWVFFTLPAGQIPSAIRMLFAFNA